MDTILLILIILNLIFICFVIREELTDFFKNHFLQMIGVISIIDTLWSFIERIFKTIDLIIDLTFNLSITLPPTINSDSSSGTSEIISASSLEDIARIRRERIERKFREIGEAQRSNRGTRQ